MEFSKNNMSLFIENNRSHGSAIVVGAGVAGLYAAYLLRKEFQVIVLEKTSRVGGLVQTKEIKNDNNANITLELGPSHHLEEHKRVRELLAYGFQKKNKEFEKEFSSPSVIVADGKVVKTSDVEKFLFERCEKKDETFDVCVANVSDFPHDKNPKFLPWWDELKHFRKKDAKLSAEEGTAFTVEGGYEKAFQKVADKLKSEGVQIFTGVEVTAFDGSKVETCDGHFSHFNVIVFAVPLAALNTLKIVPSCPVLNPKKHKARKSIRIFAFIEEKAFSFYENLKDKHIVSTERLFRWAVLLTPHVWMISYTDADCAESVEAAIDVNVMQIWKSLFDHIMTYHTDGILLQDVDVVKKAKPEFFYRDDYKGYAYHTDVSDERDFKSIIDCPLLAGEAYGPPELRAWMEGACASVETALKEILC